ncbi:hypothetical protein [Streptomyces europaeiscabiei]|uniref:Uncharacterized protein n=1 Tax=Streptomyces europaeiscabiei TaxID=146819 RepID=A0ABU4NSD6_9ACTN|nr:hypothetical protein [Streptomyces europaeiscabiei]MDX2760194.1 hypothetical protein [Streptomyces europaeiscabiei]MDX2770150.1 hypothetical protein [Streptomyces europaeiscabiei]MDX3547904.1 hypothetical protein [Streptomyces europaeiscabiei]MDX3557773.1 hypothetical protein [Streptomyces europaeiscabiei]MDX3705540.1 hypothetical protein [Streptomyces europaeiscabiei]
MFDGEERLRATASGADGDGPTSVWFSDDEVVGPVITVGVTR